jgi:hypothetical protein
MSENDPLRAVLREWQTPELPAGLDERVRAGFHALQAPSLWQRFLSARITMPVPVLAAAVVLLALVWAIGFRPSPPAPARRPGLMTRLEATGFHAVPDGVALVEDVKQ